MITNCDAAAAVRDLRAEGKTVLLHCVHAETRTPVAAYGALITGPPPGTPPWQRVSRRTEPGTARARPCRMLLTPSPYLGVLDPAVIRTRWPVRITDGGLAALRTGHHAAATLAAIDGRDARAVLVRPRRPPPEAADDPAPGHLALVPVRRAADLPAYLGWDGGWGDLAAMCAVLRRWEERFGARLVRIERATLEFALDRPPSGDPTAEHVAFCGGAAGAVRELRRWRLVPGRP